MGTEKKPRARDFAPQTSTGYVVRDANRAFQRLLEKRLAPFGITRGQWYFLRVLWIEDGLSQRELSARVGTMEPTTAVALQGMQRAGLIRRVRSADDKRRTEVWLTAKAKRLKAKLLPIARKITEEAAVGLTRREIDTFLRLARHMTRNVDRIEG
jgi:MarR family transcriptional regulator, organic hydroperoxide resistance regulator